MLWFGVRLPWLGLEIFENYRSNQPTVVTEAQKVHLMNKPAQEAGIRTGMSLATARSMYPNVIYYMRDREAESDRLDQLIRSAYEFTPTISKASADSLLLEMAGSLRLFGGVRSAIEKMQRCFWDQGHSILIGIAHTPRSSLVFTNAPNHDQWPDYPTVTMVHQLALKQLRKIPLAHLEVNAKDRDRLVNMGLRQVGELLDIPRHEFAKRFSEDFVEYLAQLTGEIQDPWDAEQPVETFNEGLHLIDPIRGKAEILEPMEHLVSILMRWLERLQLGVRELRWGVYTFEGDGAAFEVSFEQPRYEFEDIMAITRLRMEVVDFPEEAMTVGLEAVRVESRGRSWVEQDILGGSLKRIAPPRELLERLGARLGSQALQQFRIREDHRPEFACTLSETSKQSKSDGHLPDRGHRPLWLLEHPKAIKESSLHVVSGPERIHSGWWDREEQRDYYIARDSRQAWCWCFHNTQGWFVHGYFA